MSGLIGGGGAGGGYMYGAGGNPVHQGVSGPMTQGAPARSTLPTSDQYTAQKLSGILGAMSEQDQEKAKQLMPWLEAQLRGGGQGAQVDLSFMRHVNPEFQLPLIVHLLQQEQQG